MGVRHLVILLGDQLDAEAKVLETFDPQVDLLFMAEVASEATHVWSSKIRIAFFLSAMRHFAGSLRDRGWPLCYVFLDDAGNSQSLTGEIEKVIEREKPDAIRVTLPGEERVLRDLEALALASGCPLDVVEDGHFFSTPASFLAHATGRRQLRLEFWYRELRLREHCLVDQGQPLGGQWNFDADNRMAFGRDGPDSLPAPLSFPPDSETRAVIRLVNHRFKAHPGSLAHFDWPVTAAQAALALDDFLQHRLASFGRYQDAIWLGSPWLYHSRLSAAMNLKLLSPRTVVMAAEQAYDQGHAPLPAVEGFIRQILGWREYVRGIYWMQMPDYLEKNALAADRSLPAWYWTGATDLACLRDAITQTLEFGYAHHIQRLMVLGLYALLRGVTPKAVHGWFLAVFVDAVEWVELPNVLGMSQYADGGLMASKPYVASGRYIQRMSNACSHCRYDPGVAIGEKACPFTTGYWAFLDRHRPLLAANPRMTMQLRNLDRLSTENRRAILAQAERDRS